MKAIILAGGDDVENIGKLHRTTLLPIPTDQGTIPVINSNVDKLLKISEISKIFILSKERHKLKFRLWKNKLYYYDYGKEKVDLKWDKPFLSSANSNTDGTGPIWALNAAIVEPEFSESDEPLLVIPGHNYFEDDFNGLVSAFLNSRRPTVAFYKARFEESVRDDLQVIKLEGDRIIELLDSPAGRDASETRVLLSCYILNKDSINLLKQFVKEKPSELGRTWKFLKWLISETTVNGYEFTGRWWDFGTEGDYGDLLWVLNSKRLRIRTVNDLIRAKQADALPDACFLLGRRFVVNPNERTITITFQGDDTLCGDEKYVGKEMTKNEVEKRTLQLKDELQRLEKAINQPVDEEVRIDFDERSGILLSGGVFLYDTPAGSLDDKFYIPLLERDYTASADPGRFTTPAGRLDDLNLRALCYSELMEEFVFYGFEGDNVRLFTIFPDPLAHNYRVEEKLIKRLLSKNIQIPGMDREKLKNLARNPESNWNEVVTRISPFEPALQDKKDMKDEPFWTVKIEVKGRLSPEPVNSVYVIFDRKNCTLEFRLVAFAQISGFVPQKKQMTSQSPYNFGRLIGIADGDGYRRRTFLIGARQLADYYKEIRKQSKEGLEDYLFNSGTGSVKIARMGDGANAGRFIASDINVPVLPLTTSVYAMAKLTDKLIHTK